MFWGGVEYSLGPALRKQGLRPRTAFLDSTLHPLCFLTLKLHTWMFSGHRCEGVQRRGSGSLWRGSSPLSRLEQHPREVLVATILVGAQHAAHLLAVDLVEDVEVLLGRAAVGQLRRLASIGVALDRSLPAEGFFLAPPPASPRVLFLTLCFLNAAPRLYWSSPP